MKRQESSTTMADGLKIHRVKLVDVPVPANKSKYVRGQEFLREMTDQWLLKCGPFGFDKMQQYMEGECWVIAMESTDVQKES